MADNNRSSSHANGGMQIEPYGAPPSSSYTQKEMKLNKVKGGSSFNGGWFNDPELQRRKRIAGYKVYSVEGKVKGSLRNSIRWLKDKYYRVVYGWW